jgi:hypothetical protein
MYGEGLCKVLQLCRMHVSKTVAEVVVLEFRGVVKQKVAEAEHGVALKLQQVGHEAM